MQYRNFYLGGIGGYTGINHKRSKDQVEQHMLLALIAPRPLYVASASEDYDADPKGEFLAAKEAERIYTLYGKEGIGVDTLPEPDVAYIDGQIGYHIRNGKHEITESDWLHYLDFADRILKNKTMPDN